MTLQRAWYALLRWYVRLGLKFYYKKIVIHGRENIPEGAVIFVANHQNAFMDALMIVCFNDHNTHFLARADIFKKPFVRKVLHSLNMIPIYRIRDGIGSLTENQKTFNRCTAHLMAGDGIVIFPEGNHGSQRRVRAISKGFTRVAFDAITNHPELKISVVPVGLNYSDPRSFRSSVSVYFGEALQANDYFRNGAKGAGELRVEVESQLKTLTTHIEVTGRYDDILRLLESSNADFLDPIGTNDRIRTILSGGQLPSFDRDRRQPIARKVAAGIASVINLFPLLIWNQIRKTIKDPVFVGSLKFGVGIFLFPAYYFVAAAVLYFFASPVISGIWLAIAIPSMLFR